MKQTLALIGNPNCGKTTLFNALTGSNQYVGNWAGVTVEKKMGHAIKGDYDIVDLPGIYALSPYSLEERVTQDFLLKENPSAIINIIDGTNLERNLYLTVQLIELNKPMVVAVNMMDAVEQKGGKIDCAYLSKLLGIPFIPIAARRNEGIDVVMAEIDHVINHRHIPPEINYNRPTQNALNAIYNVIVKKCQADRVPYAYFATKLLEGDAQAADTLALTDAQRTELTEIYESYEAASPYPDREALMADARYQFIEDLVEKTVVKGHEEESDVVSDRIDRVVTNRFLAIPCFMLLMLLMFGLTFGPLGSGLGDLIERFLTGVISPGLDSLLVRADAPDWCQRLLIDGVLGGVGGILVFLPQIAILFLCLSLLEDSGYMARAAFITDRFLHRLGLSGKSFIPMLMGFGCTTPAVMATRTQENVSERRMTIMLIPFMSCGAKLPIYALFAGALFAAHQGLVVFSMYLLGFVLAILIGFLLKFTLFKGNHAPFLLELPPYRLPQPKAVLKNTWEKCKGFLIKAGTVIFAMSVVIWLLQNLTPDFHWTTESTDSIFAKLGCAIAPALRPLGFGDWRIAVSLLSGLVAKEAVVSTLGVLFSAGDSAALSTSLQGIFTPLSAFSFMAFCLLYVPCISAFATIKREMNSWKWAFGVAALQMVVAYLTSLAIYQIGSLFV